MYENLVEKQSYDFGIFGDMALNDPHAVSVFAVSDIRNEILRHTSGLEVCVNFLSANF